MLLEAEAAQEAIARNDHAWIPASTRPDFAGDGYTVAGPDIGEVIPADSVAASSELRFDVSFDETGTYLVWIRAWTSGDEGDSVHVGLDEQGATTASEITGFTGDTWSWSNLRANGVVAVLVISDPGVHTVRVWMREDGFLLDRLILTKRPDYRPDGRGPRPSGRVAFGSTTPLAASGDGTDEGVGFVPSGATSGLRSNRSDGEDG